MSGVDLFAVSGGGGLSHLNDRGVFYGRVGKMNCHKLVNFEKFYCLVNTVVLISWTIIPQDVSNGGYVCILINVKLTLHTTALDHQMALLGGTSASAKCQADLMHDCKCQADFI